MLIVLGIQCCCSSTIDMDDSSIGSMRKNGITESYKLKRQVVISASEASEMIMRYLIFSQPH